MGNTFNNVVMEGYVSRRNMIEIGHCIDNAKLLKSTEHLKILNMIPSERNFIIVDNLAIKTGYHIENKLPIFKLLCLEGLNESHFIKVNKEFHHLITKANLYASK